MTVLETARLRLRHLTPEDAPFILGLLNEPSWLRFIGDRGVRTLEDAHRYIENGPMAMYARHGFGLYLMALKDGGVPIGLCGLLRRAGLDDVDIGFALLPAYWSHGYAFEAAAAVLAHARDVLGLPRVVAITTPDNEASARLLEKLGFGLERTITLPHDPQPLRLFSLTWPA
jgi:RimJ/RimL family protein N-acetyltransferase